MLKSIAAGSAQLRGVSIRTPGGGPLVERAAHGEAAAVEDVGIDHGGFHAFMSEQFLYSAAERVVAVFQKVCGERVPATRGVAGNALDEFGMLGGGAHGFLENRLVQMMPTNLPGTGVSR